MSEEMAKEVARLVRHAMGTFAGSASRGVCAGSAVDENCAVIVVGLRDDMAVVTPGHGPVEEKDGKLGPEVPAKVKRGSLKGDVAKLAKDAAANAIGAAVASTGLEE
jgi:hypothetical protein